MKDFTKVININGQSHWRTPNFARFKLVMRMRGRNANPIRTYWGIDIALKYVEGKPFYYRNEEKAFDKLCELIRKKKPWEYYSATIFANVSQNTDTRQGIDIKDKNNPLVGWGVQIITFFPNKHNILHLTPPWQDYQGHNYPHIISRKLDIQETIYRLSNNQTTLL